jgi:hypothetical protein
MSNRRGAPSMDKECVLRRQWYHEAQKKEFRGSDSSLSDDEAQAFEEDMSTAGKKSTTFTEEYEKDDGDKEEKESKKKNMVPPSPFVNFAATLGAESR